MKKNIINLCDTCKYEFATCVGKCAVFACDVYDTNNLEQKYFDAVIKCKTYKKDKFKMKANN